MTGEVSSDPHVGVWVELEEFVLATSESDESVRQFVLNVVGFSHEDLRHDQCRSVFPCAIHKQVAS